MQIHIIAEQHEGTCARPASDSAFLAGRVVTVTVPALAISEGLLALGNDWMELRICDEDEQVDATVNATQHSSASSTGVTNDGS